MQCLSCCNAFWCPASCTNCAPDLDPFSLCTTLPVTHSDKAKVSFLLTCIYLCILICKFGPIFQGTRICGFVKYPSIKTTSLVKFICELRVQWLCRLSLLFAADSISDMTHTYLIGFLIGNWCILQFTVLQTNLYYLDQKKNKNCSLKIKEDFFLSDSKPIQRIWNCSIRSSYVQYFCLLVQLATDPNMTKW